MIPTNTLVGLGPTTPGIAGATCSATFDRAYRVHGTGLEVSDSGAIKTPSLRPMVMALEIPMGPEMDGGGLIEARIHLPHLLGEMGFMICRFPRGKTIEQAEGLEAKINKPTDGPGRYTFANRRSHTIDRRYTYAVMVGAAPAAEFHALRVELDLMFLSRGFSSEVRA